MDLNKVMLIGNLAVDPEIRVLPSGQKVAQFRIGTNRVWVDQDGNRQEEAQFHNITAFGRRAEICEQYLKKGQKVYVEGRIRHSSYSTQDGQTRYWTDIVIENMIMLSPRGETMSSPTSLSSVSSEESSSQPISSVPPAQKTKTETPVISEDEPSEVLKQEKQGKAKEKEEVSMEDIPF